MARFLIAAWPLAGHLYPNIGMAKALLQRGHDVAFYTGQRSAALITGEGFVHLPFAHLDGDAFEQLINAGYSAANAWERAARQRTTYRNWLIGTLPGQLADLTRIITEWKPDVIICDPTMWVPYLVLHEKLGIPVAIYSYTTGCLIPGPEMPTSGLGLPRPRTPRDWLTARVVGTVAHLLTSNIRREASAFRMRQGLPPLNGTMTEHAGRMPLYIVTSTPELDYERSDLPSTVHYVGPVLWTRPAPPEAATWLERVPQTDPWVHVTEGTVHSQQPLVLRAAAQGLANLPMQVVMATGTHRSPQELGLGTLAPNIHVERWVAYDALLPRTAAVVTTGGAGTVMAALQLGLPQVVIPTEWDKPENAARIAASGAGLRLNPAQCTPERLRVAVERLLHEPSFRQKAQHIAASFARTNGPERSADLLEALARRTASQRRAA